MAFNVGEIVASVKADVSGFKKGIDEVDKEVNKLEPAGKKVGGFAGLMNSNFALAAAATGAVTAGLTYLGTTALKKAGDFEQTRISFNTMLHDGTKAAGLLQEISKFAAATPFEFPELAEAGKKLLAFGFSATDIIPNLTRLGDISSGLGIPIGELSELYGKARTQGRLFAEDINQLTGRGIPIIGELAKQFGVSEAEVRKLVEEGKVGFPQLETAFKSMTDQGGMFAGGMKAQSTSLNGLLSTLQDNIGMLTRKFLGLTDTGDIVKGGLFDKVSAGIASLIDWLSKNQDAIAKISEAIGTVLLGTFKVLGDVIAFIIEHWKGLAAITIGFATGYAVYLITALIAGLPAWWATVTAATAAAVAVLAATWPFILIGAVVAGLAYLLITHWTQVKDVTIAVWTAISSFFVTVFTVIGDFIKAAVLLWWDFITLPFRIGYAILYGIVYGIYLFISWIWKMIGDEVMAVVNSVVNWVSGRWNALSGWTSSAFNAIAGAIRSIWGGISSWVSGVGSSIYNAMAGPFERAFNAISGFVRGIYNTVSDWFGKLKGAISGGVNSVIDGVNKIITGYNKLPGTPDLPTLPRFARGVSNFAGGPAIINERGGELVILPNGSSVIPADQTRRIMDGQGGGGTINITFEGDIHNTDDRSLEEIGTKIARQLELANQGAY